MRHTGIPMIGDVPWGTHFCQFYHDQQDLIDTLVPYFKAGLENREFCMWITSEPLRASEARDALAREVPNLEAYFEAGQIEILEYSEWYTAGGGFDSARVLNAWVEKLESALARGFEGLRLTGNTFWLEKSDWRSFTDYEAAVDSVIGQLRMLAICTYSLEKCGAIEIMDVVSNHAFALIKRAGEWRTIESAERKNLQEELRRYRILAEHSRDIVLHLRRRDGRILEANRAAVSAYGYSREELREMTVVQLRPSELRGQAEAQFAEADARGVLFETLHRRKDGSVFPVEVSSQGANIGGERALVSVVRDVTDRKRAEEALRLQQEWLRVTLTSIGDAVLAADTEGRITFLNPVAAAMTGWEAREALGRPISQVFRIVNEATLQPAEDIVRRVLEQNCVVLLANQTALISRDGKAIPIEDSAAPIRDASGAVTGVVLVFHDVTAKRRAQQALRESERRVRLKLESILSPEGDIGNLELEDIIDVPAIQSLMDDFYELARIPMAIIDTKGKVLVGVGWQDVCTKFHRVHPQTCRNCIESDTQLTAGTPPGEVKLYKCKNNMWDIATPLMIGGWRAGNVFSGQFFFADEPMDRETFRRQAAEYGFDEAAYLDALDRAPRFARKTIETGMSYLVKLAGMVSQLSYSNIKLARSLAERDTLTQSLRGSERLLARSQEIAHLGSWELDLQANRLTWSDEVYRIFGLDPRGFDASYEAFLSAVHPGDRDAVNKAYADSMRDGASSYEITHRIVRADSGEVRWVREKCEHVRDAEGVVIRSVGMVQDITESKQAEENLLHTQKLEGIGLLAGGIAHDFNNLLVGVIGNASLAQDMLPRESPAAEILTRVIQSGEQAAHLTRQMLAYAGKGRFMIEPVDLSALVREHRALIETAVSKKIALRFRLAPALPAVASDPSQVHQILMNLVVNAGEAIGDGIGCVEIGTGEMTVAEPDVAGDLDGWSLEPGRYSYLEVRDTGCGIDAETRRRIFDPFFTTKFQGRGLGLAAVAGIVRAHKGAIRIETAPGQGSAFRVMLPAIGGVVAADQAEARQGGEDLDGSGTVLVVDDEPVVRDMAKRCLEFQGYQVLLAESGPAAIEALRSSLNRVHLVLLDLSMPGMSGEEALVRLRELKPDLNVLVSSGYSEDEALRVFAGNRVSGFIQKPYTVRDLARHIKAAMA